MGSQPEQKLASISDVLKHQPDGPIATSRARNWQGMTVDYHKPSPKYYLSAPALDHHVVICTPHGSGLVTQQRSGEVHKSVVHAGSVIIMPAGNSCIWEGSTPANIRLRLPLQLFTETVEELDMSPNNFELLNVFNTQDTLIEHLSRILLSELSRPSHPAQALLSNAATCALAAHLVRSYNVKAPEQPAAAGSIKSYALASVLSYIEEHAENSITLDELARIANVSRFHFSRLFKVGIGFSPMAYVEQVRIRKAQELIRDGKYSLAQIATIVGFADQSHFTRRFRLHTGCTPAVFARENGPYRLPH